MVTRTLSFVMCTFIFFAYGCGLHHNPISPEFTLTETITQQEALPLLAMVDVAGDPANAKRYFEHPAPFVESHSDTVRVDVAKYLKGGHANSLFKYFIPHINDRPDDDTFINSSMLGFSSNEDAARAEKIMQNSTVLKGGPQFRWVKYDSSNMALVAFNKHATSLNITGNDIVNTKVKVIEQSLYWSTVHHVKGDTKYMVTVTLKHDTVERIKSTFADDAPLLVSCSYNNKKIYCSVTAGQIADGRILAEHLDDEGLAFRFISAEMQ